MEGFKTPPPDVYFVKIEDMEKRDSQSSGIPYYNGTIRVLSGIKTKADFQNAKFWDVLSTSDNAVWKIAQLAVSCGVTSEIDIDNESEVKRALVGKIAKVQTKMEEYEGEERTKVQQWMQMTPEERQAFSKAMSGGGSRSALPDAPTGAQASGGTPPPPMDDVPF